MISIVTIRLLTNHVRKGIKKSAATTYPLAIKIHVPHMAPAMLFSSQPKSRKTAVSFLLFRLMFAFKNLNANNGMITCHRSAIDQAKFVGKEKPAVMPEPTMHPMYADKAPYLPNHNVKGIIKATAKYKVFAPGMFGVASAP